MDQKQWEWGKKTREKTILETDKANLTSYENEEVGNFNLFLTSIILFLMDNNSKCNYMLEI